MKKHLSLVYLDDDRLIETNLHLRQVQGTIPSSFSAGVFHLIDMLEDVGMIENGATGSFVQINQLCSFTD